MNLQQINVEEGSVLIINKPLHWTSFDVVNKIRYHLLKNLHQYKTILPGEKRKVKVGHAGTLDPLATGVLIVCIGKETKNIDSYMATEKEYAGIITVGYTTPSYDLETEPDAFYPTEHITTSYIHQTASSFLGEQQQYPPLHSAIKKDGKRLYEAARAGENVEVEPRKIVIHSFEITAIDGNQIHFKVKCSKGTYIRSLAYDFGKRLQSGACLTALCRTASGEFKLSSSITVDEALAMVENKV
ncbi:MAG: tRNA pseudouridine(55) synthase TruB [Bacteroidia bacterium]|jgi:tRNA pseudouridine55 synthase|nr:tRNA pseudouridine(55) synthase TruB [Bacteroidia bacterium]